MNIASTYFECMRYRYASEEKRDYIRQQRLKKLVQYAKKHSPYLAKLYENIGEDFQLRDLPITSKKMVMENYEEWVTDRSVRLDELKEFVKDSNNIGRRYKNKYSVVTTSGSTGYPLIFLLGKSNLNAMTCESLIAGQTTGLPTVVCVTGGRFVIPAVTLKENMRRFPFLDKLGYHYLDSTQPINDCIDQLEKIQPKTCFSNPSTFASLADCAERRNIKIHIDNMVCGSEMLTTQNRRYIEKIFGGKARGIYGCTEGGNIAYECDEGHLHLNNSWVILEPVDENYDPVPFGTRSTRVLMTNLSSYPLPIIRYEVTDRIVMHDEPCSCGNPNPWIQIDGRSATPPLHFTQNGETITISAFTIYALLETMDTMRRFQIVVHKENRIECRIVFMPGVDKEAVMNDIKRALNGFLNKNGIKDIEYYLSDIEPQLDPVSSKFISVYQAKDE